MQSTGKLIIIRTGDKGQSVMRAGLAASVPVWQVLQFQRMTLIQSSKILLIIRNIAKK
jgi:hypothetical protein